MTEPRLTFIVHSADQAASALMHAAERAMPVYVCSAEGAGLALGAPWFAAMIASATVAAPAADAIAVLDCGAYAGAALAAFRHGITHVRVIVAPPVRAKLACIAKQSGCQLVDDAAFQPIIDLDKVTGPLATSLSAPQKPLK